MITGIHHITIIAGDAQENFDFYAGVMGMRLVKKSVNQDVPDTYHLFYADYEGHAGTDLTFFPWAEMQPGQKGIGLTSEVALAVPTGSLGYWTERLANAAKEDARIRVGTRATRFGEKILPFTDPHGVEIVLAETSDAREFTPWAESPVPQQHQVRGLHGIRILERDVATTAAFLTTGLGFTAGAEEDGWRRYTLGDGGSGRVLDLREDTKAPRGQWGRGSVHHVAWRVPDDATELAMRAQVRAAGRRPTEVIDRFWFKSVYFTEPGGALFEIATDGPGFTADEEPEHLGEKLVLPPWLEPNRPEIEASLPPLH